VSSILKGR